MDANAITIKLKPETGGLAVPISFWRNAEGDTAPAGSASPMLCTTLPQMAAVECPCMMPTKADLSIGRAAARFTGLYDFNANEVAMLSKATECTEAAAAASAASFCVGYGSPLLDQLYDKVGGRKNLSIMVSEDGKQAALIVGRDLASLRLDTTASSVAFEPNEATGARTFMVTAVNGAELTFPFGMQIDTSLSDCFLTYVPLSSDALENARTMPFSVDMRSSSRSAMYNPQIAFNQLPDMHRREIKEGRNTAFGLGFCVGKCITFDDASHIVYIQDIINAPKALPSIQADEDYAAQRAADRASAEAEEKEEEDEASKVYTDDIGLRAEPNLKTNVTLPDSQSAEAQVKAKLAREKCASYEASEECLAEPDDNCRWNADESTCYETFWKPQLASAALLLVVPLSYVAFCYATGKPHAPFWRQYPIVLFKTYRVSGLLAALAACVLVLQIHVSNARRAYRREYTVPQLCLMAGASLSPLVLALSMNFGVSIGWAFPFTVLAGYAAVRIAKQELQAATDSVRYLDLLPAYILLFHTILVDGLMWWLLLALS